MVQTEEEFLPGYCSELILERLSTKNSCFIESQIQYSRTYRFEKVKPGTIFIVKLALFRP